MVAKRMSSSQPSLPPNVTMVTPEAMVQAFSQMVAQQHARSIEMMGGLQRPFQEAWVAWAGEQSRPIDEDEVEFAFGGMPKTLRNYPWRSVPELVSTRTIRSTWSAVGQGGAGWKR